MAEDAPDFEQFMPDPSAAEDPYAEGGAAEAAGDWLTGAATAPSARRCGSSGRCLHCTDPGNNMGATDQGTDSCSCWSQGTATTAATGKTKRRPAGCRVSSGLLMETSQQTTLQPCGSR
jgi:hypothetical protein